MTKLPAFTLLEAVLSLFLVALLGVFAIYILQYLQQGGNHLSNRATEQQELLFFNIALRTDMNKADAIYSDSNGDLNIHAGDSVTIYSATPDGISRKLPDGKTSSFALNVLKAEAFTLSPELPLVHLWRLTLKGGSENGVAAFHKVYGTSDRVRHLTQHVHSDPPRP